MILQKNLIPIASFVYVIQHFPKKFFLGKFMTFKFFSKNNFFGGYFPQKEKKRIVNFFKKKPLLYKRLLTHHKIFKNKVLEADFKHNQINISKTNLRTLHHLFLPFLSQTYTIRVFILFFKNRWCAKPSLP